MKKIFASAGVLLLLAGCYSVKHISSEIVLGKWQVYVADTGRNGTEQMQPLTLTFMPDGSYVSCLAETTPEETTGNNIASTKEKVKAVCRRVSQAH